MIFIKKNTKLNLFRHENEDDKEKYINEKLGELKLHKLITQIELIHLLWDFDAVSLYPSAMWDENSIYPRIETGNTFTRDKNDELVEKFIFRLLQKCLLF